MERLRANNRLIKIQKLKKLRASLQRFEPQFGETIKTGFIPIDRDLVENEPKFEINGNAYSGSGNIAHNGVLALGAVHAVEAQTIHDMPAATGFAAHLASRFAHAAPIIWAQSRAAQSEWGDPYLGGLSAYRLNAHQLWYMRAIPESEFLWAIEEALGCAEVGCVVGACMASNLTMRATKRFGLTARRSRRSLIVVTPPHQQKLALTSKWQVAADGKDHWRVRLQSRFLNGFRTPSEWRLSTQDLMADQPITRLDDVGSFYG